MDTNNLFQTILDGFIDIGINVEIKKWNKFLQCFGKSKQINNLDDFLIKSKKVIDEQLGVKRGVRKPKGLYAFYNQQDECLYIGKANNLPYRIYHHLKTSVGKYDKRGKEWFDFFYKNPGNYSIYWIEIDFIEDSQIGETLRICTERILTSKMLYETMGQFPKFEMGHPSIK